MVRTLFKECVSSLTTEAKSSFLPREAHKLAFLPVPSPLSVQIQFSLSLTCWDLVGIGWGPGLLDEPPTLLCPHKRTLQHRNTHLFKVALDDVLKKTEEGVAGRSALFLGPEWLSDPGHRPAPEPLGRLLTSALGPTRSGGIRIAGWGPDGYFKLAPLDFLMQGKGKTPCLGDSTGGKNSK